MSVDRQAFAGWPPEDHEGRIRELEAERDDYRLAAQVEASERRRLQEEVASWRRLAEHLEEDAQQLVGTAAAKGCEIERLSPAFPGGVSEKRSDL
ncbi:hypothetical protein [Methylobacterium oryzisoli]|uniref:hypothetical protein n=1 Tax=Methylobacterium oryzisoli TaxID=3385502 RepID=UPI0038923581